jgi:hypothetical protein
MWIIFEKGGKWEGLRSVEKSSSRDHEATQSQAHDNPIATFHTHKGIFKLHTSVHCRDTDSTDNQICQDEGHVNITN